MTSDQFGLRLLVALDVFLLVSGLGTFQVHISTLQRKTSPGTVSPSDDDKTVPACRRRTFVRYCLTNYQSEQLSVPFSGRCEFGEVSSPAWSGCGPIYGNVSAVSIPFTFTWPKSFTLITAVYDDMTPAGPSPNSPRRLVVGDVISTVAEPGGNWTYKRSSDVGTLLEYAYRVVCDIHHFGSGCSVYCKPRDDQHGHWTCASNTGQRLCLAGWQGTYCQTAICAIGCNTTNGYCNKPGECVCRSGWQGEFCNECVVRHAIGCTPTGGCDCLPGWRKPCCNIDVAYCSHNSPCLHGGTCINDDAGSSGFRCVCEAGFTGVHCEYRQCGMCLNSGSCDRRTGACKCGPRYTGRYCETRLDDEHHVTTSSSSSGGKGTSQPATLFANVTTTSSDDVTRADDVIGGAERRRSDNRAIMWVLGVTLGGLLVSAMLVVVCGAWLVWRRRRRQSTDTETSGENTRVQPETADSEVASSRNNMSPYYSRYTRDGTLVLTIANNCAGSDVMQCAAWSNTKNDVAMSSRASPAPGKPSVRKPSISTVSDDVMRFSGTSTVADDVNVWSHDRQAGTRCDRKYLDDNDDYTRAVRSGAGESVRYDCTNQYISKNLPVASSSSSHYMSYMSAAHCFADNYRREATSEEFFPPVRTVSALLASTTVPLHRDVMTSTDRAGDSSHVTLGHVTDV